MGNTGKSNENAERVHDPANQTRRVHLWWQAVQEYAAEFGEPGIATRHYGTTAQPSVEWLVAHIAGCLLSYAARKSTTTKQATLQAFSEDAHDAASWQEFDKRLNAKRIRLGMGALPEVET